MRDTQIHISKENLLHNINVLKNRAKNKNIIPVLKANAYGHGIIECAKLIKNDVEMVSVAYISEAEKLRNAQFNRDILLLVPPTGKDANKIVGLGIDTTISDLNVASTINEIAIQEKKLINVHVFINTGMNRDGIKLENSFDFFNQLKQLSGIKVVGILSHFAVSDQEDYEFSVKQKNDLIKLIHSLENEGLEFKYKHISNTGGILNYDDYHFNTFRAGIGTYGLAPNKEIQNKIDLKPVLSLKSKIHHIIEIKKGETAGYNFEYIASSDTKLGIIPIGYGDGYSQMLSGKTQCIIQDGLYDIVGSICMDLILVNIKDSNFKIGEEVILIGKSENHEVSVYDLAEKLGTIPYQITTMLTDRIPRVIL